jgi:hypothetical protein
MKLTQRAFLTASLSAIFGIVPLNSESVSSATIRLSHCLNCFDSLAREDLKKGHFWVNQEILSRVFLKCKKWYASSKYASRKRSLSGKNVCNCEISVSATEQHMLANFRKIGEQENSSMRRRRYYLKGGKHRRLSNSSTTSALEN